MGSLTNKLKQTVSPKRSDSTYKIIKRSQPTTVEVPTHNNVKQAGAALGGGVLLGPVGAVAGYALAKGDGSPVKEKIVTNENVFKNSQVSISEDRIDVSHDNKVSWSLYFDNVRSLDFYRKQNAFSVKTDDNVNFVFKSETAGLHDTKMLFHSLENKLNTYSSQFCSECGSPLEKGANFCSECGQKIN